jgi:anaphase-promoting complex subunit 2
MIKDIQDSRRVDGVIRRSQRLDPSEQEVTEARASSNLARGGYYDINPEGWLKPSLHAKILSRLFWPQLHDENYRVPNDIAKLQQRYEYGFESLKNSRKLTWLHALGQATVELELRDRIIYEEVHTWQATVIWAFQANDEDMESPTRSVDELVEHLEMDETLVRSALSFWVGKMVLRELRKDEYAVLETLNKEDLAKSNAQAVAAAAVTENTTDDAALVTGNEVTSEKMQMYWQFIQGMLTNSSPQMPLQQIAMMLKMLIIDGFPYSNEELQEFLSQKVKEGALDFIAGKYKLKK